MEPTEPPQPPHPPPTPSHAPPTLAPGLPDKETAWPGVLGAVAVVFGLLGALGALLGVLMVVLEDAYIGLFANVMPPETAEELSAASPHPVLTGLMQALGLLVAVLLLVAGTRLLKRRRSGAKLLRIWAITKIVLVVIGTVVGLQVALSQISSVAGVPPEIQAAMTIVGVLTGLLWGSALPVFSLLWLRQKKIQAEVAGWEE